MSRFPHLLPVIALAASGCGEEPTVGAAGAPLLEFRIAHDTPEPGFPPFEFDGDTVYLTPWSVLDDSGIEALALTPAEPGLVVSITLYSEAAERMREVTGRNVGGQMAVLVAGEVRSVPGIMEPVGGSGPIQLALDLDPEEAEAFARAARERWRGSRSAREPSSW